MSLLKWLGLSTEPDAQQHDRLHGIEEILAALGAQKARYLACFAYILTRPARADHEVSDAEAALMERIIAERTGATPVHASMIVNVARQAAGQSGGTDDFIVTREFERMATREEKLELLDCLFAVSAADQSILTVEDNEVRRVASELKLEHADYIAVRARHIEHLRVLRRDR
jgi:uncharacterized tellurite resistance protein B-like protein